MVERGGFGYGSEMVMKRVGKVFVGFFSVFMCDSFWVSMGFVAMHGRFLEGGNGREMLLGNHEIKTR